MNPFFNYFSRIYIALKNLIGGMKITWRELWRKKVTMQYPENRETLQISERWRSELYMPHDENNEHACTACGICMTNCPNGTITVTHDMVESEDGKKKKVLNKHIWDYGMCTFCNICVITCPSDAIFFNNDFEGAVFDRSKFVHTLNKPGSKLREKKAAPKPAATPKPAAAKPAAENTVAEKPTVEKPATPKVETQAEAKPAEKPAEAASEPVAKSEKVEVAPKAETEKPLETAIATSAAEAATSEKPEVRATGSEEIKEEKPKQ